MINEIIIEGLEIGPNHSPKIIAEIGINHGGSIEVAKEMVNQAVAGGAHLIKHQTHIPSWEMSIEAEAAIPGNTDKSIFQVMQECALSEEDEFEMARYTRSLGAIFFSTPFSREAVDRLEKLDTPAYKIGSGECNNYPLVEYVASKGKPVVLSTGMNTIASIRPAVEILRSHRLPYALMHTTNLYPTPSRLLRLGAIEELRRAFPDAVIGLSDHSISNSASYAAVAMGASLIERHFTDTKDREGPDIICSMDTSELVELGTVASEIYQAMGGAKGPALEEQVTMNFAFSSVAALRDIAAGEIFTKENIFPIRPSGGDFGPVEYPALLGKVASRMIKSRTQLKYEDVDLG